MEFEKSSIERLKRTLYSRNENLVPKEKRTPVQSHAENTVPKDWGAPASLDISYEDMAKRNNSFFNKFLVGSVAFFLIALGIALFIFFGGINMISSNNIDVQVLAPSSVSSGEELLVSLTVVNGNRTDLEGVSLLTTYPSGSQSVGVSNKPLVRDTISLGTIKKGASLDHAIRVVLSGEKDSVKTFTFKIEYKVKGSNAVFSKEKTYDVLIGSSPIFLDVSYPAEVNSGQTVTLSIDITSNSGVVIKSPLVKVEYPYGFTYKESNMAPLRDNSVWNIGDLKNGDKKNLTITGTLVGQNSEDRSFRVSAGTPNIENAKDFETPLVAYLATIGIRKSFFDLSVSSGDDSVAYLGQNIPVTIEWQNTIPDKVINGHIEATISGNVFNRASVSADDGGFYRSLDNTVVWDKNTLNNLRTILPGGTGTVRFSLASVDNNAQSKLIKNQHVDVHVVMKGDRAGIETGALSSSQDYVIKLSTSPTISAKTNRSVGPFSNTGPVPPRADKESTYTVTWTVSNTSNDLKDVFVTATLPPGVVWKEQFSPQGEKITYNSDTKTVSWSAGSVFAGAGYSSSPKEVSFKVGVTPSLSQVGSVVALTSDITMQGVDTYTLQKIRLSRNPVDTRFSDPTFSTGNDIVGR